MSVVRMGWVGGEKGVKDASNGVNEVEIDDCPPGDTLLVKSVRTMKQLEFCAIVSNEWEGRTATTHA